MCVTSVKNEFWQYELEKPVQRLNSHVWGEKATTIKQIALAIVLPILYIGCYALALIGRAFCIRKKVTEIEYRSMARITDDAGVTTDATFKEYMAGVSAQIMPKLQELIDQGCTKLRWIASLKIGDNEAQHKLGPGRDDLTTIDLPWLQRRFNMSFGSAESELDGVLSGELQFAFYVVGTKEEERFGFCVQGRDAETSDDAVPIEWRMTDGLISGNDPGEVYEAVARDIGREPQDYIKTALSKS